MNSKVKLLSLEGTTFEVINYWLILILYNK